MCFLQVAVLSATLKKDRHEIRQFPPRRVCKDHVDLASVSKSLCRSASLAGRKLQRSQRIWVELPKCHSFLVDGLELGFQEADGIFWVKRLGKLHSRAKQRFRGVKWQRG